VNDIEQRMTAESCGRVLVVDDDEKNRRLLADMLDASGYTVRTANDGVEALEQAVAFQPEAILLDIMMPKMDGVEACRRLKADPATASIPVLLTTALHERPDRIRGLAAGANDFLSKPLDVDEECGVCKEASRPGAGGPGKVAEIGRTAGQPHSHDHSRHAFPSHGDLGIV